MKRLRKQFAFHKFSNFKITIEGFLISLIIIGIPLNLYKNRFYDNSWTVGEWLISYSGGFIRRGLPGQVIFYLSSNIILIGLIIIFIFSFLAVEVHIKDSKNKVIGKITLKELLNGIQRPRQEIKKYA